MALKGLSATLKQQRDVPSVEEWDAARIVELGVVRGGARQESSAYDTMRRTVAEMHWLSLVCFIEHLEPAALLLQSDIAGRVAIEVSQLRGYDPLEAYAVSLDILSDEDRELGSLAAGEASNAAS